MARLGCCVLSLLSDNFYHIILIDNYYFISMSSNEQPQSVNVLTFEEMETPEGMPKWTKITISLNSGLEQDIMPILEEIDEIMRQKPNEYYCVIADTSNLAIKKMELFTTGRSIIANKMREISQKHPRKFLGFGILISTGSLLNMVLNVTMRDITYVFGRDEREILVKMTEYYDMHTQQPYESFQGDEQ